MTRHKSTFCPGMSLTELMVAVALMAIIMAAVLPLVANTRKTWDVARNNMEAVQDGRVLTTHLNRYLGQAVRITDVSPASQTLGYIEFEDTAGDTWRYDVDTDGNVEYGLVAAQTDLAGPVSQLLFTCYDANDFISPITDVNSIRFVEVQATMINQGATGQDNALATSVYLQVNGNNNESESTMGTPFEFEAAEALDPSLTQIDSTHYLCAYSHSDMHGHAVVLTVDTGNWSISKGPTLEYDAISGREPALAQIDSTHYLCSYRGPDGHGWAVVLTTSSGLVGHWKFDETSGIAAADASGMGNHGALINMSGSEWSTGMVDGALSFDGSQDYVDIGVDSSLMSADGTISFWVNTATEHAGSILSYYGTNDDWFFVGIGNGITGFLSDELITVGVDATHRVGYTTSTRTELFDGDWHHIAITAGSDYKIYLDGVPKTVTVGLGSNDGTWSNLVSPTYGAIGADKEGPSAFYWYLDGSLDDVRVYDRALSASEIAALATTLRYENFTEAKAGTDTTAVTVSAPVGTSAGDLLVAAVATDGDTSLTLAPPGGQGWTQVSLNDYINEVTLGAWWKLAGASEPSHQFTWSGAEQAYAWIMRFTGHDPAGPIDVFGTSGANSSSPGSPAVTTTVDNALILRLGAFDGDDITEDAPGLSGHTAVTMDASASSVPEVTFEAFAEAKAASDATSLTIGIPAGTSAGDLLIAALAADGGAGSSMAPPAGEGWTAIQVAAQGNKASCGCWWKLAGASESSTHQFTWSGGQQAYGWIMRFTGHDPASPIHQSNVRPGNKSSTPDCPSVTTTLDNCLILSLGGFDDDDINLDVTGLEGHTTIAMDESSSGSGTSSGGAGYQQQAAAGTSAFADFNLSAMEEHVTITVALAPGAASGSGMVSGGAGYVKQSAAGGSGSSSFAFTAIEQAQMLTVAIAPAAQPEISTGLALTQGTAYEFETVKGWQQALLQIDPTHYLCAWQGDRSDGWAVVLTVNTSNWTITQETPFEFDKSFANRPALVQIDATHYLCAYTGPGDNGWAVVLTVNTSTWTLSKGTPIEFDTVYAMEPALAQIDSTRYLCAYRGDLDDGWSKVLIVDPSTWTLSEIGPFEFDTVMGQHPALIQIDADHYLCAYSGDGDDGWSVVLAPSVTQILP